MSKLRFLALWSVTLVALGTVSVPAFTVWGAAGAAATLSVGPLGPGSFVAVAPSRLLDTRRNLGGSGPVAAHGTVHLQVTGGVVPSNAAAVVLDVTAIAPSRSGYITAYPDLTTAPIASDLNFAAGQTI